MTRITYIDSNYLDTDQDLRRINNTALIKLINQFSLRHIDVNYFNTDDDLPVKKRKELNWNQQSFEPTLYLCKRIRNQ